TTPTLTLTAVTQADVGNYSVIVSNNAGVVVSSNGVLTLACPTISLSPTTLPKGATGAVYNQTIVASGGQEPYTYALSGGALPRGLELSSAGSLAGTPTNGGSFTFAVTATDAIGCQGSQNYSLSVLTPPFIESISLSEGTVTIIW